MALLSQQDFLKCNLAWLLCLKPYVHQVSICVHFFYFIRASGKAESNQADSANENSSSKKVVKRLVELFKLKFLKATEDLL